MKKNRKLIIVSLFFACLFTLVNLFSASCEVITHKTSLYLLKHRIQLIYKGSYTLTKQTVYAPLAFRNTPYQKILKITTSIPYQKTFSDEYGNTIAIFTINNVTAGQTCYIDIDYLVETRAITFWIDPSKVSNRLSYINPLVAKSLNPERWIESDDPQIKQTARMITAGETNPYYKARKIFNFVRDNVTFNDPHVEPYGAVRTLQTRQGDCTEFSDLFIALCRASGIPAQWNQGFVYMPRADNNYRMTFAHNWAEFYLEGYGWLPADALWERQLREGYFAQVGGRHILLTRGRIIGNGLCDAFFFYYFNANLFKVGDFVYFKKLR